MDLVTGGLGFIGNELVRQLKNAGRAVVILDNRHRMAPRDQSRFRKADKQVQKSSIDLLEHVTGWRPDRTLRDGLTTLLRFEGFLA